MVQQEWGRAHAKGAEVAEGKGRPPIEEDWGRCFSGCGPQPPKGEGARRLNYGERGAAWGLGGREQCLGLDLDFSQLRGRNAFG